MCGIAGILDMGAQRPVERARLECMARAMLHRGPDEGGVFVNGHVGLAARRLSIVDLAGGHQPMSNEDGSVTVAFNGEIYDFADLRERLTGLGHRFTTRCDTETIVHAYEQYELDFVDHLKGQFAISLWDARRRRLVLARDRYGIHPLFYTTVDGWLVFASECKAILASGLVEPRANLDCLDQMFTFLYPVGRHSMFEGIWALLPGHRMVIEDGRVQDTEFYDLPFPPAGQTTDGKPQRYWVDGLDERLSRAVERRLQGDVPVVAYLSGGLDSSMVVALMREVLRRPVKTFTIALSVSWMNEAAPAKGVARHLQADQTAVFVRHQDIARTYPKLVRAAEVPVLDTSCACLYDLAAEVHRQGFKVVLTGEGGDEVLAGYGHLKMDRLRERLRERLPGPAYRALGGLVRALSGVPMMFPDAPIMDFAQREFGFFPPRLDEYMWVQQLRRIAYNPDILARRPWQRPFQQTEIRFDRLKDLDPLNRSLYVGYKMMLAGLLMWAKGDRLTMGHSVEGRYPFLDEDVVEFCARMPVDLKLRGPVEKYVLHRLAMRYLPKSLAMRTKKMFMAMLGSSFTTGRGPSYLSSMLSHDAIRTAGYFDPAGVDRLLKTQSRWPPGAPPWVLAELGLVLVIATQLWHDLYIRNWRDTVGVYDGRQPQAPASAG